MSEDTEQKEQPTIIPWFAGFALIGLIGGFFMGAEYQQHKDKSATTIFDAIVHDYREMEEVATFPSYHGEKFFQRMEIENTESGIGYIEVHYLPRAAVGKIEDKGE